MPRKLDGLKPMNSWICCAALSLLLSSAALSQDWGSLVETDSKGHMIPSPPVARAEKFRMDTLIGLRITDPRPEIGFLFPVTARGSSLRSGPLVTSRAIGWGIGARVVPVVEAALGLALTLDMEKYMGKIMVYGSVLKF